MKSSTSLVLILSISLIFIHSLETLLYYESFSGGCPLYLGPTGVVINTSGRFNPFQLQSLTISLFQQGGAGGAVSDLGGADGSWWSHSASQQC